MGWRGGGRFAVTGARSFSTATAVLERSRKLFGNGNGNVDIDLHGTNLNPERPRDKARSVLDRLGTARLAFARL